jgi:hypothetical protein
MTIPIATTLENIDTKRKYNRSITKILAEIRKAVKDPELASCLIISLNFHLSELAMLEFNIERGLAQINIIEPINAFEPNIYTR